MTMDIPVNAEVRCADGACGRSTYVIINPTTKQVTHLVVEEGGLASTPRLVPVEFIAESTPHSIRLRCTKEELAKMEPFLEVEYVQGAEPFFTYAAGEYMWPYGVPEAEMMFTEHKHVPQGELTMHRGARVEATDGHVGRVDEFLVDPQDEHITHLVLREGHLWGQKDVTIPASQIDHIEENTIYLKLDKHSIQALPAVPARG
jgi:sporulation protein YlmC with PRC-barrel domain